MRYLSADEVLALHIYLMKDRWSESLFGLRDRALLESAVERPVNVGLYGGDVFDAAARLWEGLTVNHPFLQGNKRTALATTEVFLRLNGRRFAASDNELISVCFAIAQGQVNADQAAQWLREHAVDE